VIDVPSCLLAADLHGRPDRYDKLIRAVRERRPEAVFLGGDLLPFPLASLESGWSPPADFARDFLAVRLQALRELLGDRYPAVYLILGNDDPRAEEPAFIEGEGEGLWHYCHDRRVRFGEFDVYGYSFVPPTPFMFKDWEKYDVSRYVPPGGISPEEGRRSVPVDEREIPYQTIQGDLERLAGDAPMDNAVFLFHTPPHETNLDRAATDGRMVDHVPLDLHVGSIAVRRFIESRQPLVTLHGHIHESARIMGNWRDRIGRTHALSAAHDGPELSLVTFDPLHLESASRELL
jgi:Icc-related predicted phosphoesterase